MRVVLKILAVLIGLAVLATILMILRMSADLGTLAASGLFGWATLTGWTLILVVGPFAAIKLWRLQERGRQAALLLAASALAYYAVGWLAFRGPGAEPGRVALRVAGNLLLLLFLLSPPVRRACGQPTSAPASRSPRSAKASK